MKKSQLRRIIREEIQKEIKTSPHQFGSDAEKEYQLAAAELSNAVLELDSDDPTTRNRAQVAYEELGPKLEAHLKESFGVESFTFNKDMYDKL